MYIIKRNVEQSLLTIIIIAWIDFAKQKAPTWQVYAQQLYKYGLLK
jgi:hypothetical protein